MAKAPRKAEYGDFQTPPVLARAVCSHLAGQGLQPAAIVEPTCGQGSFLCAALDHFPSIQQVVAADINADYVRQAKAALQGRDGDRRIQVVEASFFVTDWERVIAKLPQPILVLGNPPWVTNAHLGALGSQNLPRKSNFQNHDGLDAITGKANFDISEWMLIRLLEAMDGRHGTLAMLCKSSVARKVLCYGWTNNIGLARSAIYRIDADLHFAAAVDAALLVTHFAPNAVDHEAKVLPHLANCDAQNVVGYEDGMLLADIAAYRRWKHLCGEEVLKWRSGIKHDCAKVMELKREGGKYRNGLGEVAELEETYIYPMLKSSNVANGQTHNRNRYMIVTQRTVGEDTAAIENNAPRTWAYLKAHANLLDKRASSIYRGRAPYSMFGVGNYSFAPWKVAISGFYKRLAFSAIGPVDNKAVVLDDTSYFLPCQSEGQALYLLSLLNSPPAQSFYRALVFWDSKRPITAETLRRLDLRTLAREVGSEDLFNAHFAGEKSDYSPGDTPVQLALWV